MPTGSKSRTVDLYFTPGQIDALAEAAFVAISDPRFPDDATAAVRRLLAASREHRGSVSKVDRASLQALATFLGRRITSTMLGPFGSAALADAVATLERRLQGNKSGPKVDAAQWQARTAEVEACRARLRDKLGYEPTDAEIEQAAGVSAGTLRRWRHRKPDLFG